MKTNLWGKLSLAVLLCLTLWTAGAQQNATPVVASSAVPSLISYNGVLRDGHGGTVPAIAGVTFLLYKDQEGGLPLWLETQNVIPDRTGHYTVHLGAASSHGLPAELFQTGEARWLGVSVNGGPEQPRVLLLSVPYALKAADAETVGGLPPSAFVLAAPSTASAATSAGISDTNVAAALPSVTGSGTANLLPLWTGTTTIGNSVVSQSGTGSTAKIGINTTTPAVTLDVKGAATVRGTLALPAIGTATSTSGKNSQPELFTASVFNSVTSTSVTQKFQWQAEAANNNTSNASGTLNLLYGSGTSAPAETGLRINSKGLLTFAAGQTFPGTGPGTVKSVALSAPTSDFTVSGSPITSAGTLSLAWKVSPTNVNTANAIVRRDASGGFAAAAIGASTVAANTGVAAAAIIGNNTATGGTGVFGNGTTNGVSGTGGQVGVLGKTNSGNGAGVLGQSSGVSGIPVPGNTGVAGISNSGNGVYGFSSTGIGVSAQGGAAGVYAVSSGTYGVYSTADVAVYAKGGDIGVAAGGSSFGLTASGASNNTGGVGVKSIADLGVEGIGTNNYGVYGQSNGSYGVYGTSSVSDGVHGESSSTNGAGVAASNTTTGDSLYTENFSGGYAAYIVGDAFVTGSVSKSGGSFKIDHPLDPANKYLYHSFVESPDMMNIYNGEVTLDANGEAAINLPEWFGKLNRDFRYQLTAIGAPGPNLHIAEKIHNNHFRIAGGQPAMEVSWQVTGIRQDAWANAHRIPVEELKPRRERGFYLHPELFGAPVEKGMAWAHRPEIMKQPKETRANFASRVENPSPVRP